MCICLWKLTWQWLKVNANGKLCCESTRRREPVRHFDEHKKYFYLLKSQRGCKSTWQNLSRLMLSITLTSFIPTLKFFRPFKKLVTGYFWYFCKLSETCFVISYRKLNLSLCKGNFGIFHSCGLPISWLVN